VWIMGTIFKAYDVRGIYPAEINEAVAYKLGRAAVIFLQVKSIVVGRDGRLSSPKLFAALIEGITDQGAEVIDAGLCSTPMFYFCSREAEASIMVTASHNPKDYNGFKLCREKAFPISEENGIKAIQQLVEKDLAKYKLAKIKGKVTAKNNLSLFVDYNLKFVNFKRLNSLKLVLDAGNGMCGYTFPKIFARLNGKLKSKPNSVTVKLIEMYTTLDFSFPHHQANPLDFSTLKDLQHKIVTEKADFGIATDGDGDRCIFVDEKGAIIPADIMTALISIQILADNPGAAIMHDVRCSKVVAETINQYGGRAVLGRVGHSFIKQKMRQEKIKFAGELSGHMYYQENNYCESSFISTAMVINLLSSSRQKLSELVNPLRKYFSTGEINTAVKNKLAVIKQVEQKYSSQAQKVLHLDGLSMYFKDWWFNLRASNTEDALRLNLEADSNGLMEKKKKEILGILG